MITMSPSYKRHLENQQNEIDAQSYRELKKLDLYNEKTFYPAFSHDLLRAEKEVVIYCPFISKYRSEYFRRIFERLKSRNIAIFIFTRSIEDHELLTRSEIKAALRDYEELGACIINLPGLIHAKTAIIDRKILWDGSLNILSQRQSREMMRRTEDEDMAKQVMEHLELNKKLAEGYKYQYERLYRNLIEKRRLGFRLNLKLNAPRFHLPKFIRYLPSVITRHDSARRATKRNKRPRHFISGAIVLLLKCIRAILILVS